MSDRVPDRRWIEGVRTRLDVLTRRGVGVVRGWFPPFASLTPSGARFFLIAFVVIKIAVSAWNCTSFDGPQYDADQHAQRAHDLGLKPNARQYDGPLYYWVAALGPMKTSPARIGAVKDPVFVTLRTANLVFLGVFYLVWVVLIFPALLPDWRTSFVASAIFLATPAYQLDAVTAHPDNLLALLVALAMAIWLRLWRRPPVTTAGDWLSLAGLSLVIGLMGPTRALGVAPMGILTLATLVLAARGRRLLSAAFVLRATLVSAIVVPLALAWPVYRWNTTKKVGFVAEDRYIAMYEPYRKGFDFVHYFTSFYPLELLGTPNRKLGDPSIDHPDHFNPYANSFFTVAFSNVWGDHWLYFSGKVYGEQKLWPKRVCLLAALPLAPLFLFRPLLWLLQLAKRPPSGARGFGRLNAHLPQLAALAVLVGGAAAFLYWQTGSGLLPGKNSTIKFLYNAYLYPFALSLLFFAPLGKRSFNVWVVYVTLLFGFAFPVSMWWPLH